MYRRAEAVLPCREEIFHRLPRKAGVPDENIISFPHEANFEKYDNLDDIDVHNYFSLPNDAKIISYAARLEEENYPLETYKIAKKVIEQTEDTYFVICGDGTYHDKLKNNIERDSLEDRIVLPGYVDNSVVFQLRKNSLINLCLVGGLSLIEACYSGRPVISYDIGWHHELIEHGETGYLFPENDVESVIEIITNVARSNDKRKKANQLGRQAREKAIQRHSHKNVHPKKMDIYRRIMGRFYD